MAVLDIGVLGELTVARDSTPVAVTGPGRRALLGLLATTPDRVVTVERIVDGLWGAAPPGSAVKVVQTHVSQLRRVLEPGRDGDWQVLVTHPSGYELAVGRDAVDAVLFEAAVQAASHLPVAAAVAPLREALSLWRGPPYAGIDRPFAVAEAARLEQLRSLAVSRCLAGELGRGRHHEVEPELRALVSEHPFDESLAELLMLALYRSGRQADALRVYTELRHRVAGELGIDPGPSVARLHERILRHDPGLDLSTARSGMGVSSTEPEEGNLPAPRSSFVGRHQEVREVAAMARRYRLTTLVGAGGAGKTRLALLCGRLRTRPLSSTAHGWWASGRWTTLSTSTGTASPNSGSPTRWTGRPATRCLAGSANVTCCWCSTTASISPPLPPGWSTGC